MKKYFTWNRIYPFLTAVVVFLTLGEYCLKMTTWTINNVLCNPVFIWALCSILLAILVFAVNPLYNHFKIENKAFKLISYVGILGIGCLIIFLLPKGDCSVAQMPVTNKTDSSVVAKPVNRDTASKTSETVHKIIYDTVPVYKAVHGAKSKSAPIVSQKNDKGDNNSNSGVNLGNIGGQGNSVTNNFEKPARHVTPEFFSQIEQLNVKKLPVEVFYFTNTNESATFGAEIVEGLKKRGDSVRFMAVLHLQPDFPKDKDLQWYKNDTMFQITVWPQIK